MEHGEVWWADLELPSGPRPVLILTRSQVIRHLTRITIAPLTRSARPIRSHVRVWRSDGVPVDSVVNLDNVQTISKEFTSGKDRSFE